MGNPARILTIWAHCQALCSLLGVQCHGADKKYLLFGCYRLDYWCGGTIFLIGSTPECVLGAVSIYLRWDVSQAVDCRKANSKLRPLPRTLVHRTVCVWSWPRALSMGDFWAIAVSSKTEVLISMFFQMYTWTGKLCRLRIQRLEMFTEMPTDSIIASFRCELSTGYVMEMSTLYK